MSSSAGALESGMDLRLVLGLLVASGCSGALSALRPDEAQDKAQLARQAADWDAAIIRKDAAAIERNMADDFRSIQKDGSVCSRVSFLGDLLAHDLVIDPYTVEEFEVRLFGDVALLTGRTRMTGKEGGAPFTSHYRYTDTYVRRGGRWKVVSVQITGVRDPKE
jgi:ketosteroid isomerase-like protein